MKIARADIFRYALPLVRPLTLAGNDLTERRGYLVRLESDEGHVGWGDIAPLPGFSRETFEDAGSELRRVRSELVGSELPPGLEVLDGELGRWLWTHGLPPSVQCGVEMALLNLTAGSRAVSLARLLSEHALESVRVNALISHDNDVTEKVRQFKRDGYRAVKLKVGRRPPEDDIRRTRDAFHELGGDTTLRLDANRAWDFEEAVRFAEGISDCTLAYIEEPLADPSRLEEFVTRTGLRVALDESLVGLTPSRLNDYSFVSAVVLKPTLLGGFERSAQLARVAKSRDMKVVISSSFESSVGIAALAQLAAAFDTFNTPAGLDTLTYFEKNLLAEPIEIAHGRMRIGQIARVCSSVNMSALEEVSP
jgi:O-succinylbenzoate synthase